MRADPLLDDRRGAHVPLGPRAYRSRLRVLGPLLSIVPAAAMGALATLLVHDSTSVSRGGAAFGMAVLAAPGLLAAGIPLSAGNGRYVAAIAASVVLWLAIGVLAAFRATQRPAASWRDFWREWTWPAAGAWIGVIVAVVVTDLVLGRAVL